MKTTTVVRRMLHGVLLVFVFSIVTGCAIEPERLAITNVTAIDAVNGVVENVTVVIDGERISAVAATTVSTENTAVIDGTGKFLIPGLWDMHVHLTYDARFTDMMPDAFLSYGITSVRDTGGLIPDLRPVVDAWRKPEAIAPNVFFSGPLLDGQFVVYDGESAPEIGQANANVAAAIQNVDALNESGVDFIKIYEMVSPEVFSALSKRARELSLPIASHVPLSMRASTSAPYVDSMEHLRNIEMDCAGDAEKMQAIRRSLLENDDNLPGITLRRDMHELHRIPSVTTIDDERCRTVLRALRNVLQVPTARLNTLVLYPAWQRADWGEASARLPAEVKSEWLKPPGWFSATAIDSGSRYAEFTLTMIGWMRNEGVPIAAGTDTPIGRAIPGYSLHTELERLVLAGLSPMEAIESATIRPAEFFGLQASMGEIAIGMQADLVLLNSNPLLDISNTRDIAEVIYRGTLYE